MVRYIDWPERMARAIEAARRSRFRWGHHDCALFVCAVVKAMTGVDMARRFRGRYADEAGAYALAEQCGGTLAELAASVAREFGRQEVPPAFAQRGDVVLVPAAADGRLALGVCVGQKVLAAGPRGLVPMPMEKAVKAWRI